MTVKRYGLGREYMDRIGMPGITEQADGPFVRFEDYEDLAKKLAVADSIIRLGEAIEAHRLGRVKERVGLLTEILKNGRD